MAREARKISSTGMYYVSLQGNTIFRSAEDKKTFLEMLGKYFEGGEIYGYNLSETEIRLVVKETPKGISMTMKPLVTSYARYYNKTYNLTGKVFAGRFKSEPIESEKERKEYIKSLNKQEVKKSRKNAKTQPVKKTAEINRDTKTEERTGENFGDAKKIKKKKNTMPSYLL